MIAGRGWSYSANCVALREVFLFGLGLEKLKWNTGTWRLRHACLHYLLIQTGWPGGGDGCRQSQDQPRQLQNKCFTLRMPSSASLANGTCVFLSFFYDSDYPFHSICCSVASSSLARVELRIPTCDGWALAILECRTASSRGVRRSYLPLHQQCKGCEWDTVAGLNWGCQQKVFPLYYINPSREPRVDIKFCFWMIFNKYTTSLLNH